MLSNTCLLVTLITISARVLTAQLNNTESCALLYEKGVESYLENNYEDCVINFEGALEKYRFYTKKLQNCRLKCSEEAELSEPLFPVDVENLHFYEKTIKNTLCIMKCKKNNLDVFGQSDLNKETVTLFEKRKPYEYLHICYYQINEKQKAASAAFTYLASNPQDEAMQANLKFYSKLDDVNMNEIVNYEAQDYVYFYIHGSDAYDKKDWDGVIQNMEESLLDYLQSENECRAQCEGPFDHGWYPDFIPSIANHFTYCLRCKRDCPNKLNTLNGEKHEDLLPSHYHFLQFAYYKKGDLLKSCQAVASYLLFYPDDDVMLNNMKFYKKLPKVTNEYFTPREEAIRYVQRQKYEMRLLKFVYREFKFEDNSEEITDAKKYRVLMDGGEFNGHKRFVADGLANVKECRMLMEIAKTFAVAGDGYYGNKTPHTQMEKFEGVTLERAALLVYFGLLDSKLLKLYLEVTEEAKIYLQDYFKLNTVLYFTYTHLVCRSAFPDSPLNRTDYSHAIHADNCNILKSGVCKKSPPAYTWRDYSAILYLNDDFEGGEFIFSADIHGDKVESVIKPKCGRMVAFSSGVENLHGVRAVKRGSRCAIGLWFTFDRKHLESGRNLAYQMVN